jgi:hypothetical protein
MDAVDYIDDSTDEWVFTLELDPYLEEYDVVCSEADEEYSASFYMPAELETEAEGSTDDDGDRLNVGDLIVLWTCTDDSLAPVDECQDTSGGEALTMGAASLAAAGTAALALALGI